MVSTVARPPLTKYWGIEMKRNVLLFLMVLLSWSGLSFGVTSAISQIDVSMQLQVVKSGLVLNRSTNTFNTTLLLTNTIQPLYNALTISVAGLPNGVSLYNAWGKDSSGNPTIQVAFPQGALAIGEKISNVLLQFNNPGKIKFTFSTRFFGKITQEAPTIKQLYPTQASSATKVVVNGSGFTSLSKITLGTQTITPEFISVTQLSFVVPFGLNQNGALIPFQVGEYPVIVDGSNPVNFTVIDLPDNPNPPGQLLASQVDSAFQLLAVAVPKFQANLPKLLSEQQGNPSAQKFIQDLADLANYINSPSVQAELTTLSNQIDQQSLDTLERSLLPIQNASNTATLTNSTIKKNVYATINSQQSSTNTSCYTLTNGDDWLACRNNIKVEIPDSGAPPVPEVLAARAGVTLGVPFEWCEKAAEHWPPAIELAIACKLLGKVVSVPGILYDIGVASDAGTLRRFTVNIAGRDLAIDKLTNTPLSTNSTEVDISVHLNNYDNNQDLSKQASRAKYINGATLDISPSLNWVKISTELVIDNAGLEKLEKYTSKIPFLDGLIKKIINLAADKVNDKVNPPSKKLQISNSNISSIAAGVGATCNQYTFPTDFIGNPLPPELQIEQSTDLKWLVQNKSSVAHLGEYIDTQFGCKYMINEISRLPSEDDIVTKIHFSIKLYPQITVNVNGSGYVTYEVPSLSGHQSCTHETSPCTEYFDLPPKPSLPFDPNYTNVKLTAYNSDGTEAESAIWTGDKTDNCTGNASCLITPDPTNTAPPVITANVGLDHSTVEPERISAGSYDTCGIRTDGTVACWGRNDIGQASPPGGSFMQVSAGYYHTCGIRTDGSVACWGDNSNWQASPPEGSFKQISAGSLFNCGIRTDGSVACWGISLFSGQLSPPGAVSSKSVWGKDIPAAYASTAAWLAGVITLIGRHRRRAVSSKSVRGGVMPAAYAPTAPWLAGVRTILGRHHRRGAVSSK
jgi:hypothetical protein